MAWFCLACHTALMVWVLWFGGADRLEGGLSSIVLVHPLAQFLSARLLAAAVVASWLADLAVVLLGGGL